MKSDFPLINDVASLQNEEIIQSLNRRKIDHFINHIKSQLALICLENEDKSKIKLSVSLLVNELITSSNLISQQIKQKPGMVFRLALKRYSTLHHLNKELNHLFYHIQNNYINYLDCSAEAPEIIKEEAKAFIAETLPVLENHFLKLEIDQIFTNCLLCPLRDLACNNDQHHTFLRVFYLKKHCKKLLDFRNSTYPIKNHNLVLCKILLEENYNSNSFLHCLCLYINQQIDEKTDVEAKLLALNKYRMLVNQASPATSLAYSPNYASARDFMLNYIMELIDFHGGTKIKGQVTELKSKVEQEKISLKLTSKQAACLFNVLYHCNLFHEEKIGHFIEKIASHFLVNTNEEINPTSFRTFFYCPDPDVKEITKKHLFEGINYINEDNSLTNRNKLY